MGLIDDLKARHQRSVEEHREARLQKEYAHRDMRKIARTEGLQEERVQAIKTAKFKVDQAAIRERNAVIKREHNRQQLKKALSKNINSLFKSSPKRRARKTVKKTARKKGKKRKSSGFGSSNDFGF